MSFTNFFARAILRAILSKGTGEYGDFDTPPALWLAAYTVAPNEAGSGGTEVSGNDYARVELEAADFSDPTDADPSATANAAPIEFPQANGGNWGTVVAVAICDAETTGNILMIGALAQSRVVNDGNTLRFETGDLDITLD